MTNPACPDCASLRAQLALAQTEYEALSEYGWQLVAERDAERTARAGLEQVVRELVEALDWLLSGGCPVCGWELGDREPHGAVRCGVLEARVKALAALPDSGRKEG